MNDHNFTFTHDWISGYFPLWDKLLPRHSLNVLEIGCYEGRATVWFMQRTLGSTITCIDTFKGGHDHQQAGIDFTDVERRFRHNTEPWAADVTLRKGTSYEWMRSMPPELFKFDVVLVDGSHLAADVFTDIALAWPLLSKGGIMILDDYGWGSEWQRHKRPAAAIDAFLDCYRDQYELLEKGYQVIVKKL